MPGHRNDPFDPMGAACHRGKPIVSLQSDLICTSSGLYKPDPDFGLRVNEIRSVFPPRGNSSRKFRNELSLFKSRTRHGGFKSQKFRIEFYTGKLPRWKLLSISIQALISNRIQNYPIRLALTKSYEKSQILEFVSRYILEIEIRNRAFQTIRGLRTNELQSPDTYFDT